MKKNIQIKSIDSNQESKPSDSTLRLLVDRMERSEEKIRKIEGSKKGPSFGRFLGVLILAIILSIVGTLATYKYLLPYLATKPLFSQIDLLKPLASQEIQVIEQRQIHVSEERALKDAIKSVSNQVVLIAPQEALNNYPSDETIGSGFIITSDGLILTTKNVAGDVGRSYTVVMWDGKFFEASIKALDPASDIVILKVKADNLPVASLGYSSDLEIGDGVVALGSTLSTYQNIASVGIIANLQAISDSQGIFDSRTEKSEKLVGVDTFMNPRCFGGPLVNLGGQVVGVNITSDIKSKQVLAIPIDKIKPAITSVIKKGYVSRPYLGLRYVPITKVFAQIKNLPVDHGALVQSGKTVQEVAIIPQGPADFAGIKQNDIILKINDKEINENNDLTDLIQEYEIGNEITLTILRNEQEIDIKAKLGEMK